MKKSYFIAFLIAVVAVLWVASGLFVSNETDEKDGSHVENTQKEQKASAMSVKVKTLSSQPYTKKITVNGRSEASKDVTLRAETQGQVLEVLRDEGQSVVKGEKIVKIDVRERSERVREARELMKQRKIEYDAARRLIKKGFVSDVRLAQTQSAYESARAGLKRAEIDLEKTIIISPFDGILGKRHVDMGDYLRVGDPVSKIVDLDPLKVTVFVNEKEVLEIKKGNKATLRFSGMQDAREGEVTFISPTADSQKRTFEVQVEMDNKNNILPAGITAQVDIEIQEKQAFKIPQSILSLDDQGAMGVKVVDDENKVIFKPITLIEDTPEYLWITGVNNGDRVIVTGQDFVITGQDVIPVEGESE